MSYSQHSDTWVGRLIGDQGRYRLEQYLGGGGMGDVFLATDTLLGKQVALKLLKGGLIISEGFSKRFAREVSLCAALKSDHIVQVHDYGVTSNGEPFYVMEYLEGETLGQRLARLKQLPPEQAIGIVVQVCKGLQAAHEGVNVWKQQAASSTKSRVVHRDLKPENIFLVPTVLGELVKIIDFGIAKIYDEQKVLETNLSFSNQFLGTFRYASPEQWENRKELDGRADIYSLGMIFYEMLSGTDPFASGDNKAEAPSIVFWARAHTQEPPRPLRSQPGCKGISLEIEAVVMKCLEKSPDRRFTSVVELGRAIIQAAAANNLPLNISIPQLSHLDTPTNTDNSTEIDANLETAVGQFAASIAETVVSPHTPSIVSDPTIDVLSSQPPSSETTQKGQLHAPPQAPLLKVLLGTGIIGLLASLSYIYWQGQSNISNNSVAILEEVKTLKSQAKYEECISKSTSIAKDASNYSDFQVILNQCQLEQAKQLASEQKFDIAIAKIAQIPASSSIYVESQKLAGQWSEQIITLATSKYQKGNLNGAIAQVNTIPKTSPTFTKAQATISNWKKDWQTAELQFKATQSALKDNNLQAVLDAANKIPKIAFWQTKVKPIVDDATARIARNNQPAIAEPSAPNPAPANPAPSNIPDTPTVSQPERPSYQSPPEPERPPVYVIPPIEGEQPSQPHNGKDEGI